MGWTVANITVNDGRSVLTLDHDWAGVAALVVADRLRSERGGRGPSATTGVRHYQRIQSAGEATATWYDQFPGGCVTSQLHLTSDPNGEFAAQAPQVLGFTSRAALQEALSRRSDGRLQLDPERPDEPAEHGEVAGAGQGRAAVTAEQEVPAAGRRSRTRLVVQVLSLVLVVAIFYYLFTKIDLARTWAAIAAMTWQELATLGLLAVWNHCTYALVWMA